MKYNFIALLFAGMGLTAQNAPATLASSLAATPKSNFLAMEAYGVAPHDFKGGGFGMGVFSPALKSAMLGGTEIRIGGDFYITGLDHKTIHNVPLLAPQTGNAKVKLNHTLFAFNAVARLSLPWSAKVSPYGDLFAGLRFTGTDVTVTPDRYQPGYEKSTSESLDNAFAFQYGVAGGLLISLGKQIKLNTGVVFSRSNQPGSLNDIHTADVQGSGLVMNKKALKHDLVIFKLGLTFLIDDTKNKKSNCCHCCGEKVSSSAGGSRIFNPRSVGSPNKIGIGVSK